MNMRNGIRIAFGALFAVIPCIAFAIAQPLASIITVPGMPPAAKVLYCFDVSSAFKGGIINHAPVVTVVASNTARTRDVISFVALANTAGKALSSNAAEGDNRELAAGKFSYTFRNFRITKEDMQSAPCVLLGVMGYGGDDSRGMDSIQSVDLRYDAQNGESCGDPVPQEKEKPSVTFTDIRKQEQDRLAIAQAGRAVAAASCSQTNSGATSPGTMANDATYGSIGWSTPDNAKTSNDTYTTVVFVSPLISNYLKATNVSFSIPTGATINGIVVEVEKKQTNGTTIIDDRVRIVKGGTIGSTDKSTGATWPTTEAYVAYGSSSDLWGETWSASDINGSTFGFVISNSGSAIGSASVDHMRITVYYTPLTCASVYDSFIDLLRTISRRLACRIAPTSACKN